MANFIAEKCSICKILIKKCLVMVTIIKLCTERYAQLQYSKLLRTSKLLDQNFKFTSLACRDSSNELEK